MVFAEGDAGTLRRILLASTTLYRGGGIASVSRCIVRAFEGEREAGRLEPLDTLSLEEDPAGPRPRTPGLHEQASGSSVRFAMRLCSLVRRRQPDLVLFDHAGLARVMRLPLPGLSRQRYAIFAHGGELDVITGGQRRAAFEGAELILTNSEFTARSVRSRFPAIEGRVRAVPLCIDPELIELWEGQGEPNPRDRSPAVLIVGRLWSAERGKGHDALLAAMPKVRARIPEAELWIVGDGDDAPRLEAKGRELGITEAVRFLGRVPNEELGRLYRKAAVYAMPSRQEGFGLVYAEAMWHGLPCVGSTKDAAGEVIDPGETGLLVPYDAPGPLADALIDLLSYPERAARMGAAAAALARRRFGYQRFRRDLLAALGLADSESARLL